MSPNICQSALDNDIYIRTNTFRGPSVICSTTWKVQNSRETDEIYNNDSIMVSSIPYQMVTLLPGIRRLLECTCISVSMYIPTLRHMFNVRSIRRYLEIQLFLFDSRTINDSSRKLQYSVDIVMSVIDNGVIIYFCMDDSQWRRIKYRYSFNVF